MPDEQPSPWTAAISSFLCFSIGALIPLLPYLLGRRRPVAGAGRRRRRAVRGGRAGRPLHRPVVVAQRAAAAAAGRAAAGATYGIGALIGVEGGLG